jgi:GTP pyrophosphokinase
MQRLLAGHGLSKEEDLLAGLGFGRLSAPAVAGQLVPEPAGTGVVEGVRARAVPAGRDGGALEVTGDSDFLVYIAKCCGPLPGEPIVGYVTRGKGVAVHSRTCPNGKNLLYHPEREIDVSWSPSAAAGGGSPSRVDVTLMFESRGDMLELISHAVSTEGSKILSCQLRTEHDDKGFAAITIAVRDAPQFNRIVDRLQSLSGMLQVERRGVSAGAGP